MVKMASGFSNFAILLGVLSNTHLILVCYSDRLIHVLEKVPTSDKLDNYNKRNFEWDPSSSTWIDYYINTCGVSCDGKIIQMYKCLSISCYPCVCNKSCHLYGTCCLSHADTNNTRRDLITQEDLLLPNASNSILAETISCRLPPSPPYSQRNMQVLMVTKCPSTWDDAVMRRKCEKPEVTSLDDITPYTLHQSSITFSNVHCAICHGYHPVFTTGKQLNSTQVQPWQLKITCIHFQQFYHLNDTFQFYEEASRFSRKFCRVLYIRPEAVKECGPWHQTSHVVDTCSLNDSRASQLCHELQPILSLEVTGYKNIFCALCNGDVPNETHCGADNRHHNGKSEPPLNHYVSPILILFDTINGFAVKGTNDHHEICTQNNSWQTNEGVCIPPVCTKGKVLVEDDGCQSAIPQIQGLGYNLTLIFKTSQQTMIPTGAAVDVSYSIFKILGTFVSEIDLNVAIYVSQDIVNSSGIYTGYDYEMLHKIEISGHILATTPMERDVFEETMANFTKMGLNMDPRENLYNISLRRSHLGSFISDLENAPDFYQKSKREHCNMTSGMFNPPVSHQIHMLSIDRHNVQYIMYSNHMVPPCRKKDLWDVIDIFIDYTHTLTCPFFSFNITQAPVIENDTTVFTFLLRDKEINVTSDAGASYENGLLHICLDLLNKLTESVTERRHFWIFENTPVTMALYYLEIVCHSISVVFLLFSIITYSLFPPLRSLPGLNNMCLSLSLMTAQTSLLFTSLLGIRGYFSKVYCLIHAMIVHYSWLATYMWMNICCIHMYRVFTATGNQFNDAHSDKKRHRRYCIFSFGIPAIIVSLTIGITLLATDGNSTGYSDEVCFLDTFTSIQIIILGFFVPFTITSLINGVLFALTVREIVHVSRMTEQVGTRKSHGVIAYIKLSSLTGIFCVLAAVSVQFRSPIVALIAAPFAALQGLFLFLSFLANRHVFGMYKALFSGKEKSSVTSSQSKQANRMNSASRSTSISSKATCLTSI